MWWRRYTIRNDCNNDLQFFKQEYPSTPTEAFLTTGMKVFDGELISQYMQNITSNKIEPKRGELVEQTIVPTAGQG